MAPVRNWVLLEHELAELARAMGFHLDQQSDSGDKIAIIPSKRIINLTQMAQDLMERGVMVDKRIVSVRE